MSTPGKPEKPDEAERSEDGQEAERKRRRAEVFGDVLPDTTQDERADSWGDQETRDGNDDWFRDEVPPHHG